MGTKFFLNKRRKHVKFSIKQKAYKDKTNYSVYIEEDKCAKI